MMEAVIFDLDGVVVKTDEYHYLAWKEIAEKYDLKFDYEMNHMLRGVSREESLKIILDQNKKKLDQTTLDMMLDEKNSVYRSLLKNIAPRDILPGVPSLLISLKQNNIKVAIGSSSRNTQIILDQLNLTDTFDVVVNGNDIKRSKPDSEIFLLAAEKLSSNPKSSVVVEDANAGIEAAVMAGMFAIGVGPQALKNAHLMLPDLLNLNANIMGQYFSNWKRAVKEK